MFKKLLTVAIVLIAIGTTGTVGYADGGDDTTKSQGSSIEQTKTEQTKVEVVEQKDLEIVGPEDKKTTTNNIVLLSGIGKEGTNVIIEVYSTVSINKDAFTLDNLPKDDEYILLWSEDFEITSIGSFAKELELKKGLYKIVFNVKKDEEVEIKAIRYIQIKDIEEVKEALENVSGTKTKPGDTNAIQPSTK